LIGLALGPGRNAMVIWDDLVDQRGFVAGYASVRRFVTRLTDQRRPDRMPSSFTAP
jgi:hypothetical protein